MRTRPSKKSPRSVKRSERRKRRNKPLNRLVENDLIRQVSSERKTSSSVQFTARGVLEPRKKYHAVLCLGAVIRGATPHFEYIAGEAAKGIGALALEASIPVLFGVLTTDNLEQAIERAGAKSGNKGWETALAAIEMINLYKQL